MFCNRCISDCDIKSLVNWNSDHRASMQTELWEMWNLYTANELYDFCVIMFLILTICVSGESAQ